MIPPPADAAAREDILRRLLGAMGESVWIEPTFRCDYGSQITIGSFFFANYDCIFLDVAPITIGSHVMLGPRVCLYTAGHPTVAEVPGSGAGVRPAHHHRRQRVDRRQRGGMPRRFHRRGQCDCRRRGGDPRHSRRRHRRRKPLPGPPAPDGCGPGQVGICPPGISGPAVPIKGGPPSGPPFISSFDAGG